MADDHPSPEQPVDDVGGSGPPLTAQLEALLYLAQDPMPVDELAELCDADPDEVDAALHELAGDLAASGRGLALRPVGVGWRLSTAPLVRDVVERFVLAGRSGRLTQAALETLAVVAYKQPIARADVSDVRGVNADGALRSLVARGLVAEVGRAETPGQPVLFGTTPLLLEKLGLRSLSELPALADHLPESAPDEPALDDLARARRLISEGRDLPATGRSRWDPETAEPGPRLPQPSAHVDPEMDELTDRLEQAAKAAMKRLQSAVRAAEPPDADEGDAAGGSDGPPAQDDHATSGGAGAADE